ncbi:hypothetical protein E2562_003216 [Oryza meyeriana var. granulata]|uniref:DUF7910 domain-containing protein n=1 Tax=Oryza meyeriana var. granulata TaxID=110450 RepID=A0A6G1EUS1_9ORYZ|nr:hypothetical protein E2562_003216 [Oryza meyeriana var. granulata]
MAMQGMQRVPGVPPGLMRPFMGPAGVIAMGGGMGPSPTHQKQKTKEDELKDLELLLNKKTYREKQNTKTGEELLHLIHRPTAKETAVAAKDETKLQFKSVVHMYLAAEQGGGAAVVANRAKASEWETFKLWRIDENTSISRRSMTKLCTSWASTAMAWSSRRRRHRGRRRRSRSCAATMTRTGN